MNHYFAVSSMSIAPSCKKTFAMGLLRVVLGNLQPQRNGRVLTKLKFQLLLYCIPGLSHMYRNPVTVGCRAFTFLKVHTAFVVMAEALKHSCCM